MADLSRDEAREMRDTGRRAMEQVARVAREAAAQAGMSRTFARVSKVNADGTLQLELGSDLHPMPLYSVRMTTACAAAQPGDTVVVDTYAHVPLATGVVHTAGSADHLVPEHSQDASTIASGTLNPARLPPATTSSPGAVSVGGGLKVSGGRLSVDNGAYVSCPSARRLFTGSVVRKVDSGADSVVVFTDSKFKRLFGRSINISGGDFVAFFNGDAVANDVHVDGSSYLSANKSVYAVLNKKKTNAMDIRLNYVVVLV